MSPPGPDEEVMQDQILPALRAPVPLETVDVSSACLMMAGLDNLVVKHMVAVDTDFRGAQFQNAHLFESNFTDANMSGAFVEGLIVSFGRFDGVNLDGAEGAAVEFAWTTLKCASFVEAELPHSRWSNCNIQGAVFRGAVLTGGSFEKMSFTAVDLRGCDFEGAKFVTCDLRGALLDVGTFERATLEDCRLD